MLASSLREKLSGVQGVTLRDPGVETCGIVTFTVDDMDASEVKSRLAARQRRINVSVSTRNSAVIDFDRRGLNTVVRSSVHYYLNETDLQEFAGALATLRR